MLSIVQFFHPGKEHGYDKNCSENGCFIKDWNTLFTKRGKENDHKRKFLLNEGSYVKDEKRHEGKLLFWGEWEPPSKVTELKQQTNSSQYGINPNYLHRPFLPSDDQLRIYHEKKHYYHNSDPFVFGNNFIYGICRQKHIKNLRSLKEGSLIIFGSSVNHRFVIDTVFVVKTATPYLSLNDITKMNLGKYPDIATKFITDKNNMIDPPYGLTLYTGATFDDPINGMYSFVPAKVYNGEEIGFPRFFMPDEFFSTSFTDYFQRFERREGRIFEGGAMGVKGSNESRSISEVYRFWEYIKTEVSKDYVLGYNFKMPEVDNNFHWKKENCHPPENPKKGSCGSGCS
jgi:hypothetical protein